MSALPESPLPRSALLAAWLQAQRAGLVGVDELADAVRGEDPRHLVVWPDRVEEVTAVPARCDGRVSLALPVPGDLVGLAGPPELNLAALEAGEAVLVGTSALVPTYDARTVVWHVHEAKPAPWVDDRSTATELRGTLTAVTRRLVELDVASWQPEIPDMLMNLRHRGPLPLPPGLGPRTIETVERAVLCLEIVRMALSEEGGAVSSYEMSRRREALTDLDRAARHALVGACSEHG